MAYESKVSRKYFGSTFAGRVQPEKETQLKQLSKSLASVSPQLANMGTNYALGKKQDAVNELNLLRAQGKSAEEINAIILKGDNTALSNMYSENVVQTHNGRFAAADTINKIIESQESGDYDYTTMNLQDFYSPFITEHQLDNQSTNYQTGFAAVFNNFSANQKIKDAEDKGAFYQQQKLDNVAKLLSPEIIDIKDIHDFQKGLVPTVKSFSTSLPNVDGKPSQYLSNPETNSVLLSVIEKAINNAQRGKKGIETLEWADSALDVNLGKGKGGNELGTLFERSPEAQALRARLRTKMVTLENQQIKDDKQAEEDKIDNILQDYSKIKNPSFVESEAVADELAQNFGVDGLRLAGNVRELFKTTRFTNEDPTARDDFLRDVAMGKFSDRNSMILKMNELGIPQDILTTALNYQKSAEADKTTNSQPIALTNIVYKNSTKLMEAMVQESYKTKDKMSFEKGAATAVAHANTYLFISYMDYEAKQKAKGVEVTDPMRLVFTKEVMQNIVQLFGKDSISLEESYKTSNIPFEDAKQNKLDEEERIKAEEAEKLRIKTEQDENLRIENDRLATASIDRVNTFNAPEDLSFPEYPNDDTGFLVNRARKRFNEEKRLPVIAQTVSEIFNAETLSNIQNAMTDEQGIEFIEALANTLNVSKAEIDAVLQNIIGAN